jgi:hypothetical protein
MKLCFIASVVASCNIIFFWRRDFQTAGKKSAKIKCFLFSPKQQKLHTAEINGYAVYN